MFHFFCVSLSGLTLNLPAMDDSPPRPASALARGVQITEYKGTQVNPEPMQYEESEILLEDYLSPRKLVSISAHLVTDTMLHQGI